jgi:hypothetical protein
MHPVLETVVEKFLKLVSWPGVPITSRPDRRYDRGVAEEKVLETVAAGVSREVQEVLVRAVVRKTSNFELEIVWKIFRISLAIANIRAQAF